MPNIKLIKEPGYMYDLIYIFFLKYNQDRLGDIWDLEKEDEEKCLQILEQFEPISEDFYVFFHALKNGKCCFSYNYFSPYKELFISNYDMEFLQKELSDHSSVIRKVMEYYFYNLTAEEVDECMRSNVRLFEVIKTSNYSDTEKSRFYEFFIDPSACISKLQYELMSKSVQLSAYYEKNYFKILDVYNSFNFDDFKKAMKDDSLQHWRELDENQDFYVSFCLLNRGLISAWFASYGTVQLLGCDYLSILDYLKKRKIKVNMQEFGFALSDESRVRILEMMLQKGGVTCKEIEKQFSFSGSTAYHHLTTMLKCGVIKNKVEGKIVLYSINHKYFNAVIELLRKFSDVEDNDN